MLDLYSAGWEDGYYGYYDPDLYTYSLYREGVLNGDYAYSKDKELGIFDY